MAEQENARTVTLPSDREIVMTRVLDAPRELVFEERTERENPGHWWGPKGFRLLSYEVDLSSGGASRLRIRSPEGRDHKVEGAYLEIVEPERIVFSGDLEMDGERLSLAPRSVTFRRT